jgi:hypothetical protein
LPGGHSWESTLAWRGVHFRGDRKWGFGLLNDGGQWTVSPHCPDSFAGFVKDRSGNAAPHGVFLVSQCIAGGFGIKGGAPRR